MTRIFLTPALLCTGLVAGAGCGGQEEGASAPKAEATVEATAQAAATTPPDSSDAAAEKAVAIKKFTYVPETVEVKAGGKVTWTDEDASNHTVTFSEKSVKSIGNIIEGQSRTVRFKTPGTYEYICEFHPGMAGTVEVR